MEETKPVKLNCDFCKKEIECPPDMLDAKKHSCYECFRDLQDNEKLTEEEIENIHVDASTDEIMEDAMMSIAKETFDKIWKKERDNIKSMSKHEAAEAMFASGAYVMFKQVTDLMEEAAEEADKKKAKEKEVKEAKEK